MRIPDSLASLADLGIIEEVVRPLMSGKEAQVYLVIAGGEERVAKIYKEAENRSFKNRAEYTEGRKVRNTRDQRAIASRSSHGRAQDEAAWRAAEVNVIYRLQSAGVRVPTPYHFIDGVLIMEFIHDGQGNPAPRLGDLSFTREEAIAIHERLLREVVKMLCAGVVHGDLSDFNVLLSADGPVVIDFPQSVDPAHNQNARKLLIRDVANLQDFLARFARDRPRLNYAEEMWELYEGNRLTPETQLTGRYRPTRNSADVGSVMSLIDDAKRDERRRRDALGLKGGPRVEESRPYTKPPQSQPQRPQPQRPQQQQQRRPQPPSTQQQQQRRPSQPSPVQSQQPPNSQTPRPAAGVTPLNDAARPSARRRRRRRGRTA